MVKKAWGAASLAHAGGVAGEVAKAHRITGNVGEMVGANDAVSTGAIGMAGELADKVDTSYNATKAVGAGIQAAGTSGVGTGIKTFGGQAMSKVVAPVALATYGVQAAKMVGNPEYRAKELETTRNSFENDNAYHRAMTANANPAAAVWQTAKGVGDVYNSKAYANSIPAVDPQRVQQQQTQMQATRAARDTIMPPSQFNALPYNQRLQVHQQARTQAGYPAQQSAAPITPR